MRKKSEEPSRKDHIQSTGERDSTYLHCTTEVPRRTPVTLSTFSEVSQCHELKYNIQVETKKKHQTPVDQDQYCIIQDEARFVMHV